MLRRSLACLAVLAACGPSTPAPQPPSKAPVAGPAAPAAPAAPPAEDEISRWQRALAEVDEADPRSVDSAARAADAIGEARLATATPALAALAHRPASKKLVTAQVAAIRALGKLEADRARAAAALVQIVDRDPPPHPDLAKRADRAQHAERFELHLMLTGAAINALAELRAEAAIGSLVLAMYKVPALFTQVRRALVTLGPRAGDELRKVLRGEHAAVNQLFRQDKYSKYCEAQQPRGPCLPVSGKQFYPATVLGDFHDPAAVPDLLAVLRDPPLPAYYLSDDNLEGDPPAGPTQHVAVFDALAKLGPPEAAKPIHALWHGVKSPRRGEEAPPEFGTKLLAIVKYPFLARDLTGVEELATIAADNGADREPEFHDQLRQVAAEAFARLSRDRKGIALLQSLAQRYLDASAQKRKAADREKPRADAADKAYEAKKQPYEAMRLDLIKLTKDPAATADQIRSATAALKQAQDDLKEARVAHREKTRPFKELDRAATDYLGYARMFQLHIARIEIAMRCKEDLACYAASLRLTTDEAAKNLLPYAKDAFEWTPEHKRDLVAAAVERAMLEIGKRGASASSLTGALLDQLATDHPVIRQSILLALPKIAKLPCADCVARLDAASKADESKPTLAALRIESTVLRNYFAWAGTK